MQIHVCLAYTVLCTSFSWRCLQQQPHFPVPAAPQPPRLPASQPTCPHTTPPPLLRPRSRALPRACRPPQVAPRAVELADPARPARCRCSPCTPTELAELELQTREAGARAPDAEGNAGPRLHLPRPCLHMAGELEAGGGRGGERRGMRRRGSGPPAPVPSPPFAAAAAPSPPPAGGRGRRGGAGAAPPLPARSSSGAAGQLLRGSTRQRGGAVHGSVPLWIHAPPRAGELRATAGGRAGELRATASGRWSMALAESRRPSSLPFPHRADPPSSSGARCRRLAPPPPSHALLQLLCAPPHGFACEERENLFLAHISPRDGKCLLICLIRWRRISSCTV